MTSYPHHKKFSLMLGETELLVETGKFAGQANGAAVVTMGGTTVLATATMSAEAREGLGFFPLMVNYQEKYYAAGMIKSSRFNKREARPADDKILIGRLIDRGMRPLFPKGLYNDVQVMLTTLSYDRQNEHDIASGIAASVALSISDIPWDGPNAMVRVGRTNGEFVLNPSLQNLKNSDLDLVVTSSAENVVMIEAGAQEISEEDMLSAINFGKEWGQKICQFISGIQQEIGKEKIEVTPPEIDIELLEWMELECSQDLHAALFDVPSKKDRNKAKSKILKTLKEKAVEHFGEERDLSQFGACGDKIWKKLIRTAILQEEKRIAGRKLDQIRPLYVETGLLSRTHGSALFQRGETQALSVATLASPSSALLTEGIEGEQKHHYLHHYNFPPFSVGECSNRLSTGNREIGHGFLAQRALEPVLPKHADFPYTIRVVTEILECNGSSSMASTCGSTLALMDAGVPIKTPVAGIAMGLMVDPEDTSNYKILTDLEGDEDFGGDMDFKVTGTKDGITAIQMDIKVSSISEAIFTEALAQAKAGRFTILEAMNAVIAAPKSELSPYAPRLETIRIKADKIRVVIGKGGETIQKIVAETGADINIEEEGDHGVVTIATADSEAMERAVAWIHSLVAEPEVGETYRGAIVRLEEYGAFVEIMPGKSGLLHISQISNEHVRNIRDKLSLGQEVMVKLVDLDRDGKMKLTMKGVEQG